MSYYNDIKNNKFSLSLSFSHNVNINYINSKYSALRPFTALACVIAYVPDVHVHCIVCVYVRTTVKVSFLSNLS